MYHPRRWRILGPVRTPIGSAEIALAAPPPPPTTTTTATDATERPRSAARSTAAAPFAARAERSGTPVAADLFGIGIEGVIAAPLAARSAPLQSPADVGARSGVLVVSSDDAARSRWWQRQPVAQSDVIAQLVCDVADIRRALMKVSMGGDRMSHGATGAFMRKSTLGVRRSERGVGGLRLRYSRRFLAAK